MKYATIIFVTNCNSLLVAREIVLCSNILGYTIINNNNNNNNNNKNSLLFSEC